MANDLFIVRQWDGFDGEWMDVHGPCPRREADRVCGDRNAARGGSAAGKRTGDYNDIDYYRVFPAGTTMLWSGEGAGSQTRGSND